MELSPIISEQQYKALSDDDKKHYWRCPHCGGIHFNHMVTKMPV